MLKADKTCNKNISLCHDISCYHSQVLKKPLQNLHNLHVLYDKTIQSATIITHATGMQPYERVNYPST